MNGLIRKSVFGLIAASVLAFGGLEKSVGQSDKNDFDGEMPLYIECLNNFMTNVVYYWGTNSHQYDKSFAAGRTNFFCVKGLKKYDFYYFSAKGFGLITNINGSILEAQTEFANEIGGYAVKGYYQVPSEYGGDCESKPDRLLRLNLKLK